MPADLASVPSPATVRLRVILDPVGRPRFPEQVQGLPELEPAAVAALNARTFPPSTMNGVPMPLSALVPFVFTATGAPAPPEPVRAASPHFWSAGRESRGHDDGSGGANDAAARAAARAAGTNRYAAGAAGD